MIHLFWFSDGMDSRFVYARCFWFCTYFIPGVFYIFVTNFDIFLQSLTWENGVLLIYLVGAEEKGDD